jgi:hypothetical protein
MRSQVGKILMVASLALFLSSMALYTFIAPPNVVPTPGQVGTLATQAYCYLGVLLLASILFIIGFFWHLKDKAREEVRGGEIPLSPGSILAYVLTHRKYRLVLIASVLMYGTFYGVLTSIVAYRPDLDFSTLPGLVIPSVQPDVLTGYPLYVPEVTVFLTGHLGLIMIPLTFIMALMVSVLVGVNMSLTVFAYDSRVRGAGTNWGGQLGAVIGLFTGCPTCAGLYFFSLLGGSGAATLAVTLEYFQPLFILLSIPILIGTPYLIVRGLARVFREGCIVLPPGNHQRS